MDVVFSYQLATIIYRGKLTIKLCEHTQHHEAGDEITGTGGIRKIR